MEINAKLSLLWACILISCTKVQVTPSPTLPATRQPEPTSLSSPTPEEAVPSEEWMATQPMRNEHGYWEVEDIQGHVMVLIPAGTFTMGFTDDQIVDTMCPIWDETCEQWEIDAWHSMGAHPVTLTRSFWLDKYEGSVAQYRACVEAGFCQPTKLSTYNFGNLPYDIDDPDLQSYPILTGSFEPALRFCGGWRDARLPTEAEWEYAARGYDERTWPWGDEFPTHDLATFVEQWNDETPAPGLMPVDSYPDGQSPFGIFNMAGNVLEWTSTRAYWPYPDETVQDPIGPFEGNSVIVRGGGYTDIEKDITVSTRRDQTLTIGGGTLGVRCARSASHEN